MFLLVKCIPLTKLNLSFSWKLKTSFIIGERPFVVCQYGWCGWRIKVSSVGDIEENTRVVSQTVSFQKLAGNEYCSELEKEFRFQVICALRIYLIFQSFPWIFEFKVLFRVVIFRVVSRTDSELWHIQNPRYIKNLVNIPCENLAY